MYLKRLEIQGFKSFAKKATLEFENGITAIVGPNGSGKSNTADCLRWVLGEQSAKLMRGKKSEDVIFAGSDKKTRGGFAEVIATFDNSDGKIPVDAAEVSIGRRISRSGESEYLINNARVRLLDIVDLVLKSNIGTSRYTVIGQGTIDQMVLSGPAEIKSIIDEASGVKTYYIKRDRTMRRLGQTAENLMRAKDLLAELEPRVKSLRRQAKKLEARADIEVQLKDVQIKFYSHNWQKLNAQLSDSKSQVEALSRQRAALEQQITDHLTKIEQHEKETAEALDEFRNDQNKLQSLQANKNRLLEELSLIKGRMESQKSFSGDKATLQITLHEINQKINEANLAQQTASKDSENIKRELVELAASLEQINRQYADKQNIANQSHAPLSEVFNKHSKMHEEPVQNLASLIEVSNSLPEIKTAGSQVVTSWRDFKLAAQGERSRENQTLLLEELKNLQAEKEGLQSRINSAKMAEYKFDMNARYVESHLASLSKQKLQIELELKQADSASSGSDFVAEMTASYDALQNKIAQAAVLVEAQEKKLQNFYDAENSWKASISEEDKKFRSVQDGLSLIRDKLSAASVSAAKIETQINLLEQEITNELGSDSFDRVKTPVDTPEVNPEWQEKIARFKHQLAQIGGVDDLTIQEYHEIESRFTALESQILDLEKGMADLKKILDDLDERIKLSFNEAFNLINEQFEKYFRVLFNGGKASLAVVRPNSQSEDEAVIEGDAGAEDSDLEEARRPEEKIVEKYEHDSLSVAGVEIRATPPNKKLSSIQSLSGGERSLTSIALLCSLLTCFPSPFVVLDEVDAALDEANTIRFGQILGKLSDQTQFITITHNRETMSQATIIYGVTMGDDGVSQLLSIKMDQAASYAK